MLFTWSAERLMYNCRMHPVWISLLLFLLVSQPLVADNATIDRDSIVAEHSVLVLNISQNGSIDGELFVAASTPESTNPVCELTIPGLPLESVLSAKVTDYVFFEARHIQPVEKIFREDQSAQWEIGKLDQTIDTLGIVMFQQPFWSVHLSFWIPTALLDWNLMMKEKFTGKNLWIRSYSAEPGDKADEMLKVEVTKSESPDGITLKYNLPKTSDKLTPRGVMIGFRLPAGNNQTEKVLVDLLNLKISTPENRTGIPPLLRRIYVAQSSEKTLISIDAKSGEKLDLEALINRVEAKESGVFYISDRIIDNKTAYQRFTDFDVSSTALRDLLIEKIDSKSLREKFRIVSTTPDRAKYIESVIRLLFIGFLSWIVSFSILHYFLYKATGGLELLGISIGSYLIYALISMLFSFLLGFCFVLGIIAMESWVKQFVPTRSTLHLWMFGVMTSVLTALTVQLLN
jgi:hypothetical protein